MKLTQVINKYSFSGNGARHREAQRSSIQLINLYFTVLLSILAICFISKADYFAYYKVRPLALNKINKEVKPIKVVKLNKEVEPIKVVKLNKEVEPIKVVKLNKEVKPTKVVRSHEKLKDKSRKKISVISMQAQKIKKMQIETRKIFDAEKILFYSFSNVDRPFGRVDLRNISKFSATEFELLILDAVPDSFRPNVKLYLRKTIKTAMKHQVDPFWVLSIMWVESHFNRDARSPVNARGLMQIMPKTGKYLASLLRMKNRNKKINYLIRNPDTNIEMGVYYLKRLLRTFNKNYVFATVSYNMGPSRVRKNLLRGRAVGSKNQYLDKVRRVYRFLTKHYITKTSKIKSPSQIAQF